MFWFRNKKHCVTLKTPELEFNGVYNYTLQIHSMETMEYIKDRLYSDDLGWMNMGVWNGANTLKGDWGWSTGE